MDETCPLCTGDRIDSIDGDDDDDEFARPLSDRPAAADGVRAAAPAGPLSRQGRRATGRPLMGHRQLTGEGFTRRRVLRTGPRPTARRRWRRPPTAPRGTRRRRLTARRRPLLAHRHTAPARSRSRGSRASRTRSAPRAPGSRATRSRSCGRGSEAGFLIPRRAFLFRGGLLLPLDGPAAGGAGRWGQMSVRGARGAAGSEVPELFAPARHPPPPVLTGHVSSFPPY